MATIKLQPQWAPACLSSPTLKCNSQDFLSQYDLKRQQLPVKPLYTFICPFASTPALYHMTYKPYFSWESKENTTNSQPQFVSRHASAFSRSRRPNLSMYRALDLPLSESCCHYDSDSSKYKTNFCQWSFLFLIWTCKYTRSQSLWTQQGTLLHTHLFLGSIPTLSTVHHSEVCFYPSNTGIWYWEIQ